MQFRGKQKANRFQRFKIVFPILLAGWIPSILTLIVSYTILRDTLESRILRDRQTFVQLVGHIVGDDLNRTHDIVDYYQTLPDIAKIFTAPNPQGLAQQWLNAGFYSHPRIDGMFVTAADGRLIASVPYDPALIGKDRDSGLWREQANASNEAFISPVHPRLPDKRMVTDIVGAVRAPDRTILGYVGVAVLAERIGRRLSTIEFSDHFLFEVLDQNGAALFASDFQQNPNAVSPERGVLIKEIRENKSGHFERRGNLYSFSPIESTGWVAVVEQPKTVAYKPVHDLLGRMTVLAAWLIVLTGTFAWLGSRFYQREAEATRRIEREVMFNEKILANMPSGIAFVDPTSRRFLQANEAFAQMAQRFGEVPAGCDISEASYDNVKIAPPEAMEKVLSFGTPFQLIEEPLKDKAGMTHFVNINLLRLQGPHQTVQGVLYLLEDKTRDVTLRQELIGANAAKGQLQLSFEIICVHEILQRAHEICRNDIAAKDLQVEFRFHAAHAHVEGDPARLQQVFWNLIKNSVKFTPEKGSIIIETVNPASDEIEIRITDTGIGIEPEKIDKIFNAFEQGQIAITRRFGGLGLGLAISKAMVDAHGGKIRVDSPGKDRGSTL